MQAGMLLLRRAVLGTMQTACVACKHHFVDSEHVFVITLGSDATFLGVVYTAGTEIVMCKDCREATLVYRRPSKAE